MTAFEREMRRIFGDSEILPEDTLFTNKVMLSPIGHNLRAKVEFITTGISGHYDSLKLSIINRTEGNVDIQLFKFKDMIGIKSGYAPYIWDSGDSVDWYIGRPNANDYNTIRDTVESYIELYADQEPHLYNNQTMGGM